MMIISKLDIAADRAVASDDINVISILISMDIGDFVDFHSDATLTEDAIVSVGDDENADNVAAVVSAYVTVCCCC